MKYLYLFVLSALLSCTSTDKQTSVDKEAAMKDSSNYTTIQWLDSTEQTLPSINQGQVVEIEWRFKNAGDKPLVIANVRPGCGCTGAEGPGKPIEPGKEGVIRAKFDSKDYPGMQRKEVYVTANNSNRNAVDMNVLRFAVEVNPKR